MKLREHRGGLAESLATTLEIEPNMTALLAAIRASLKGLIDVADDAVSVTAYDTCVNYDTYIVEIKGYGVYGFTDGPLVQCE